jgi:hypothetical protein
MSGLVATITLRGFAVWVVLVAIFMVWPPAFFVAFGLVLIYRYWGCNVTFGMGMVIIISAVVVGGLLGTLVALLPHW